MDNKLKTLVGLIQLGVKKRKASLSRIEMTIINVRICVAKINHIEAKALDVVADELAKSVHELSTQIYTTNTILKMMNTLLDGSEIDIEEYKNLLEDSRKKSGEGSKR